MRVHLPERAEVVEVGPRDGFQNIKAFVETPAKLAIIDRLAECGFSRIEVTSFVHPKAVPQMADAAEVLAAFKARHGGKVTAVALVPNLFGAKKAIELGADEITFVISASERHNQENTRQSVDQSLAAFAEVCRIKGKVRARLAVATAFACPFAGRTPEAAVFKVVDAGLAAGADEVILADTIGTADPVQVEALLGAVLSQYPQIRVILHFHDTQGMGLANVLAALQMGAARFEAALGGLGGCPFAPGAAGNIATEDLVNMLEAMGVHTGIDLSRLLAAACLARDTLPAELTGHMVRAGACPARSQ